MYLKYLLLYYKNYNKDKMRKPNDFVEKRTSYTDYKEYYNETFRKNINEFFKENKFIFKTESVKTVLHPFFNFDGKEWQFLEVFNISLDLPTNEKIKGIDNFFEGFIKKTKHHHYLKKYKEIVLFKNNYDLNTNIIRIHKSKRGKSSFYKKNSLYLLCQRRLYSKLKSPESKNIEYFNPINIEIKISGSKQFK